MSKKSKVVFVCNECGGESLKWAGQCPVCGAWNSMFEEKVRVDSPAPWAARGRETSRPAALNEIGCGAGAGEPDNPNSGSATMSAGEQGSSNSSAADARRNVSADAPHPPDAPDTPGFGSGSNSGLGKRLSTGIGELDRVLGGGLVPGSLTLISGEPGIGKSTIIMQAAANIARKSPILYVSGEESCEQIKMRADRICPDAGDNFYVLADTDMENITEVAGKIAPEFLIIDSIQTMLSAGIDSVPGSISQVRSCANTLMNIGKSKNIPIFIVAHVTKSGDLAGPKIIEHLVDCVLNFSGERSRDLRIMRASKNRFGTTSEIGAFEMAEEGLIEIKDLSGRFLEGSEGEDILAPGTAIAATYEGTRPLLLEIQALTARANQGFARRTSLGIDGNRLSMILAVLERKCGLNIADSDVYVNVVGGLKPEGTSTDLPTALAIYSSFTNKPCPKDILSIAEIGLAGELRPVRGGDKIIKEASRLGFKRILLAKSQSKKIKSSSSCPKDVELIACANLSSAIEFLSR